MRFIDLYCGAGGMSLGLVQAGWEHVRGYDCDESAALTYQKNIGDVMVTNLSSASVLDRVDLVTGGPPCQGFSTQNKYYLGDERNNHVLTFARLVHLYSPRAFLMENVVSLVGRRGQNVMDGFSSVLKGYYIQSFKTTAADFGLAQLRERVFIVGFAFKCGAFLKSMNMPYPWPRWRTVRDAIGDLPEPPEDGSRHPDYFNHYRHDISAKSLERIKHVPQGGGRKDLPAHLQLECHKREITGGGGWTDVFGRLSWDGQARTITTNFHTCSKGRHVHPSADRCITPREAARLQGFPDDFEFLGNRTEVRTQIGNAVPPPMARFMGKFIMEALAR